MSYPEAGEARAGVSGFQNVERYDKASSRSPLQWQFDEIGKATEVYGALLGELTERLDPALSPAQSIESAPEDGERAVESQRVAQARNAARNLYSLNERLRLLIDRIEV